MCGIGALSYKMLPERGKLTLLEFYWNLGNIVLNDVKLMYLISEDHLVYIWSTFVLLNLVNMHVSYQFRLFVKDKHLKIFSQFWD